MKKKRKTKEQTLEGLAQFLNRHAKRMRVKPTLWESKFKVILSDLHYKFKNQYPIICRQKYGYIIDFLLTDYNIIIEIDGKKFHSSPKAQKLDNLRSRRLLKEGYYILRFWNSQISVFTKEMIDDIIKMKIELIKLKENGNRQ